MSTFDFLKRELDQVRDAGNWRTLTPRRHDGIHLIDPDGRRMINFGSNDYLGLAAEASLGQEEGASGSGASALVCGWSEIHEQLVRRLSDLEGTEAAVLFPTGFAACSGTVATLAGAEDLILSDRLNHASLIDGCRLSRAETLVFPHCDVAAVGEILHRRKGRHRHFWIVTDAVFSMDGDVAPLSQLCDLADQYGATLIVDEAHGTGVLGETGSGLCEMLGVKERVKIRIGTLSKAIGCQGGFVAGPRIVIDSLVNRCRPLIFSTAPAPTLVSAALRAIDEIESGVERRQRLGQLCRLLRQRLSLEVSREESLIPIVPWAVGSAAAAMQLSDRLGEAGFYVPAIRPPTVPEGTSRLRISLSAAHQPEMVEALASAILRLSPAHLAENGSPG